MLIKDFVPIFETEDVSRPFANYQRTTSILPSQKRSKSGSRDSKKWRPKFSPQRQRIFLCNPQIL